MKILKKYFSLANQRGVGQAGETITAYPTGTVDNGTNADDLGEGSYKFEINPGGDASNPDKIARFYDIYIGGVSYQTKVDLGVWEWFCDDLEVDVEQTFNFADLTDENGKPLPATITNADVRIQDIGGSPGYISAQDNTSFTITLLGVGTAEKGTFNVHIFKKI